jgi:uncharacterized protein
MRKLIGVVSLLLWLALTASAVDFTSLQPEGYINDFAKVVDPGTRAALEQYCAGVEQQTGVQIAVITIDTLAGEPLEDVANDIFRKWGIGKKGKDEGLLLLLVSQDRKMRLEVGYGLEPVIPDGVSGDVLRAMRPALKESRYGEALTEALNVLGTRIAEAKGANLNAPLPERPRRRASRSPVPGIIFSVVALMWLLGAMSGGRGGRYRSGSAAGNVLTGMIIGNILGRGIGSGRGGGGFGGFDSGGGFGGFGGFGGGSSGGGGASSGW